MADQHNRTPGSSWRPVTQAELLQWSVLNTATAGEDTTAATEPAQREPIDPKWVDVLLGKGDALRMKECVETVANTDLSVDERIEAFDELELLVESLDNANDLRSLKLWAPIIAQLSSDIARLRMYAAWVLGTAVQNNPASQTDFLNAGGLEPVLRLLEQDEDAEVRAKALYCISGAIRHNAPVFKAFYAVNGLRAIVTALQNAEPSLLRRAVFFWKSILIDQDAEVSQLSASAAAEHGLPSMVLNLVDSAEASDVDLMEKCLELLLTLLTEYPSAVDADTTQAVVNSLKPAMEAKMRDMAASGDDANTVELRGLLDQLVARAKAVLNGAGSTRAAPAPASASGRPAAALMLGAPPSTLT